MTASRPHSDPLHVEQRKVKGPIKFKLTLTEEQKEAKRIILANDITILKGEAGTSKTTIAAIVALDMLFRGDVERIIIARPAISAGEEIGFLPGDINEKLGPFTAPVYDIMSTVCGKEKVEALIKAKKVEVIPFAFMRGYNFSNSFIIIDEAQNATKGQLKLVLTRFCLGSKYVVCGDEKQVDLKRKSDSGFDFFYMKSHNISGIACVHLLKNFRHPIVTKVLDIFTDCI